MDGMALITETRIEYAVAKVAVLERAEELIEGRHHDLARMIRNEIAEALNGD